MRKSKAVPLWLATACASELDDKTPWSPPPYFAPEQYATVDGLRICYLEAGAERSRAIVFVHGWSGNVHNWWDQFEHFGGAYHVLAFDLPGHGKSEKGGHVDYSMELWVRAVVGLMDQRGIESATLAGNSVGGNIAARVALAHPGRVERLVLVDPTGSGKDGIIKWVIPSMNPYFLNAAGLTTGEHFPGDDPKSRARAAMIRSYVGTREERPYLEALSQSFADSYARIRPRDLRRIRAPTLLVWGGGDPVVPRRAVRTFQRHLPDSVTVWIDDAGHNPNTEAPRTLNCLLAAFIGKGSLEACGGGRVDDRPPARAQRPK